MQLAAVVSNLLSPPVLFFGLGLLAVRMRSDLEWPAAASKVMSYFLLFAIGYKGGLALSQSGGGATVGWTLLAATGASVVIPLWSFAVLRARLGVMNAAGVAATYGSVSAVTFIAATAFLRQQGVDYSGHMVAALALMESPAIIIGVLLARKLGAAKGVGVDWKHLGQDALCNGSVFLLLGSLLIGLVGGEAGSVTLMPFIQLLFPGVLVLFLLDLGLLAGRRWKEAGGMDRFMVGFGLLAPLVNAVLGLGLAWVLGLGHGDALLLVVLCASASYIAVPAALRLALPEANPGLYVPLALAVTFPFNLVVGLPLYDAAVRWVTG